MRDLTEQEFKDIDVNLFETNGTEISCKIRLENEVYIRNHAKIVEIMKDLVSCIFPVNIAYQKQEEDVYIDQVERFISKSSSIHDATSEIIIKEKEFDINQYEFSDSNFKIIPTCLYPDSYKSLDIKLFGELGTINKNDSIAMAKYLKVTASDFI